MCLSDSLNEHVLLAMAGTAIVLLFYLVFYLSIYFYLYIKSYLLWSLPKMTKYKNILGARRNEGICICMQLLLHSLSHRVINSGY